MHFKLIVFIFISGLLEILCPHLHLLEQLVYAFKGCCGCFFFSWRNLIHTYMKSSQTFGWEIYPCRLFDPGVKSSRAQLSLVLIGFKVFNETWVCSFMPDCSCTVILICWFLGIIGCCTEVVHINFPYSLIQVFFFLFQMYTLNLDQQGKMYTVNMLVCYIFVKWLVLFFHVFIPWLSHLPTIIQYCL